MWGAVKRYWCVLRVSHIVPCPLQYPTMCPGEKLCFVASYSAVPGGGLPTAFPGFMVQTGWWVLELLTVLWLGAFYWLVQNSKTAFIFFPSRHPLLCSPYRPFFVQTRKCSLLATWLSPAVRLRERMKSLMCESGSLRPLWSEAASTVLVFGASISLTSTSYGSG